MSIPRDSSESSKPPATTIWVNAEPCGYGPASVAFHLFPQLARLRHGSTSTPPALEYVGTGLALDFSASLPWAARHDVNARTPEGQQQLAQLYRRVRPSLVVTVHDVPFAETLLPLGARVVVVDSLLWYWKPALPGFWAERVRPVWHAASLVLCQNFVGVAERVREEGFAQASVIPAMMPPLRFPETAARGERRGTLVNFGGLQTHSMTLESNVAYARMMLRAVCAAVAGGTEADKPVTALLSARVRRHLDADFPFLRSVSPSEARLALRKSRTAFLASGMANIFDAVDYGARVVFLPAVSKSHGLQLVLVRKIGAQPCVIDWHDFVVAEALDYRVDEDAVFVMVGAAQRSYGRDAGAAERLRARVESAIQGGEGDVRGLRCVPEVLGRGDGWDYARAVARGVEGWSFAHDDGRA